MKRAWHHILLILTLRCEQAEVIRLKEGYGEAHWAERVAERLHRGICGPCRRAARQGAALNDVLDHQREQGPDL